LDQDRRGGKSEGTLNTGVDATSELVPERRTDFHAAYVAKFKEEPGAWSDWLTTPPYIIAQALARGTIDDVEKIKRFWRQNRSIPPGEIRYAGRRNWHSSQL